MLIKLLSGRPCDKINAKARYDLFGAHVSLNVLNVGNCLFILCPVSLTAFRTSAGRNQSSTAMSSR